MLSILQPKHYKNPHSGHNIFKIYRILNRCLVLLVAEKENGLSDV